jgi:hypothetical protein
MIANVLCAACINLQHCLCGQRFGIAIRIIFIVGLFNAKYEKISKFVDDTEHNLIGAVSKCKILHFSLHSLQENTLIRFLLDDTNNSSVFA